MPLYYEEFTELALDWPMILVGWRGFAGRKLSAEQVISHAADLIGQGTPEQDKIAALLANTDLSEWQTIDCYLEQIVEEPFDRTVALRKWRLSALRQLLRTFPRLDKDDDYRDREWLSVDMMNYRTAQQCSKICRQEPSKRCWRNSRYGPNARKPHCAAGQEQQHEHFGD